MAVVDRITIVTIHKKGESNSCIAKKLHICHETVWKVVKKFKKTGETCNRPSQGRKWKVRTKHLVKNTREKLRRNSGRSAAKIAAEAGISPTSMHWILKEDLRTYPYKMLKRHELSTTHERIRLDRCQHILNLMKKDRKGPIWCLLMRKNLTFSNDQTTKMVEFGVEMDQWKAGE